MSTNTDTAGTPIARHEDGTIDSLKDELETNLDDYSGEDIQAALAFERDHEDRAGAKAALNDAFDEITSGPNVDEKASVNTEELRQAADPDEPAAAATAMSVTEDAVDDDGQVEAARAVDGMGATEAGTPGVVLPDPRLDSTRDTVRVFTPTKSGIGQSDEPYSVGAHDVPYTLQVKNQLEAQTNRLRLDASDPLHPSNSDNSEE